MQKPKPLNLSNKNKGWRFNTSSDRTFRRPAFFNSNNKKKRDNSSRNEVFSGFFNIKNVFIAISSLFVLTLLLFIALVFWFSRGLPEPGQLITREIAQSTKIYDRTGEQVLYEIHGDQKRTLVTLNDIPKYAQQATIAIEDKNFYHHKGFSLWAIFRTAITNIVFRKSGGGSTLTQQFIKNSVLSNEKKYTRKIKELILAYRLEKQFTKDEILQMYLNEIPYGSTAYGIEAASAKYFGKTVKDINLAEAAVLAALPQAPSSYSPYGSKKDILLGRQKYIIDLMHEQGYITKDEADVAKAYELVFKKPEDNIRAPHFVMYIKEQLAEKYGEKIIEQGGLKIYTTLDLYKQTIAEEVIEEKAKKNYENYLASNAALVTIDPKNGEILAMVGSRDYFSDEIDGQVNITTSLRQPGSSLKPLVYAAAFIKGYSPNTILYDVVTNFSNDPSKTYEPNNYNLKEHGPISMRSALAGSLNIPAVKAMYLAGVDNVLELASDMGYSTLKDKDRYGLSLVLGGGEIKLVEHVNAYSVFAREGNLNKLISIIKIEDASGKIIEKSEAKETKVLDPKIARMINTVLSDNSARAYIFGSSNWLTLKDRPVAAKTGTTNDYKDAWTIGYTPSLVTGVWVGNNDNTPMKRGADGGVVAAPIWNEYMKRVLGDTPREEFKKAEIPKNEKPMLNGQAGSNKIIKIDKASGLLATDLTPTSFIEEKTFVQAHSILYYVDKNNPLGEIPKNPEIDPQFALWEKAVLEWSKKQASSSKDILNDDKIPTEKDNLHIIENIPTLIISKPINNEIIESAVLEIIIETSSVRGVSKVEYYLDNNLFSVNQINPFSLTKRIDFLDNGFHNLKIKACDDIDNCIEKQIEFNLLLKNNISIHKPEIVLNKIPNSENISSSSFPLAISLSITNPYLLSKINTYYIGEKNDKILISSTQPVENESILIVWKNFPGAGNYKIISEGNTWKQEKIISQEIFITIPDPKKDDKKK